MNAIQTYTEAQSLTAREQYRMELAALPKVTVEQEKAIIAQARAGNQEARTRLAESCLHYIVGVATHYARLHEGNDPLDFMDVIAAGNLRIAERLDAALQAANPKALLLTAARGAMARYCIEQKSQIRIPYTSHRRGAQAPQIISLEAPQSYEDDRTLLDLIEA